MNGGKGTAARSLLLERCAGAVAALGTGKNATGSKEENVAVGELLLKLTSKTEEG